MPVFYFPGKNYLRANPRLLGERASYVNNR
jgi:hypothetical protein